MSGSIPPWSPWYAPKARADVTNTHMRVSDAERSQIADALSKHYSEGRLDEPEFNERLQKAMSAKTRGDLAGLLVDLPPIVEPGSSEIASRHRRGRLALAVVVALVFATALSSTFWTWHFPWLAFAVVFFLAWRCTHRGWGRRGRRRARWGEAGPAVGRLPGPQYGRRGWWV